MSKLPEGRSAATREIIVSKFDKLSRVSTSSPCFIFKAPRTLREVNERAYEPQIISIGPHHLGKDHLKGMETYKTRYLYDLLQQRHGLENHLLQDFIDAAMSNEVKARECYAESEGKISRQDFTAMMVLDGFFVVKLFQKFTDSESTTENDDLFKQNLNLSIIAQDLLLFENQLPFFVLREFANMIDISEQKFVEMALRFFSKMVPHLMIRYKGPHPVFKNEKHLLSLVHEYWRSLSPDHNPLNFVEKILQCCGRSRNINVQDAAKSNFIPTAKELSGVGIRFRKGRGNRFFDIKFANGEMHIPTLIVNRDTERILRNLIAYEQFNHGASHVMDYARLMDCLINYADDVALLSKCGIIDNRLGSNEEVADMFNKLNDYVYFSTDNFCYSAIFKDVNVQYKRRWNLWKVKLVKNNFQNPWDWVLASIIAAFFLLLLTMVQTAFTCLAYFKN